MQNPLEERQFDSNLLRRWQKILAETLGGVEIPEKPGPASRSPRGIAIACLGAIHAREHISLETADAATKWLRQIPAPATQGGQAVAAIWTAYAQAHQGDQPAAQALDRAATALAPTALIATADDNPEPWWAAELMILHALRSHTWRRPDPTAEAGLARCVAFHLAEIQPDHATNEPWAIHAFAATPAGQLTAETLLHAALVHGGGTLTPPARLVAFDALRAIDHALAADAPRG